MALTDRQKKRYKAMQEDLRDEYAEMQEQISQELAKVKKKISGLKKQMDETYDLYAGVCKKLGVKNDLDED